MSLDIISVDTSSSSNLSYRTEKTDLDYIEVNRSASPYPPLEVPRNSICLENLHNPSITVEEADEDTLSSTSCSCSQPDPDEVVLESATFDSADFWQTNHLVSW